MSQNLSRKLLEAALRGPPQSALDRALDFMAAVTIGQPELDTGPPGLATRILAALPAAGHGVDPDVLLLDWLDAIEHAFARGMTKTGIKLRADVDALAAAAALENLLIVDFGLASAEEWPVSITTGQAASVRSLLLHGLGAVEVGEKGHATALRRLERCWARHRDQFLVADVVLVDLAFRRVGVVLRRFAADRLQEPGDSR